MLWPADETLSRGEVWWAFHPDVTGKGFATEAAHALFDVAFGHYAMHRLIAHVDARNVASTRLCERLGMIKEAHLRKDHWAKGEWIDNVIYGLSAAAIGIPMSAPFGSRMSVVDRRSHHHVRAAVWTPTLDGAYGCSERRRACSASSAPASDAPAPTR